METVLKVVAPKSQLTLDVTLFTLIADMNTKIDYLFEHLEIDTMSGEAGTIYNQSLKNADTFWSYMGSLPEKFEKVDD